MSILDDFRAQGVTPILEDGRLKLTAAEADCITPFLIELAKKNRREIKAAIHTERYAAAFKAELNKALTVAKDYFAACAIAAARASEADGGLNDAAAARYAALDAERHARDRQAGRGYDYDTTAPSHAGYLRRKDNE
jgi:hypothetical protein